MSKSPGRRGRPERSYVAYSEEIAQAICDGVAQALPLAKICRRKAMPAAETVRRWLKAYPDFAQAYGLALAAGAAVRGGAKGGFDEVIAVAICARLGAGQAITRICADPAMPCLSTIYLWMKRHPEFAAMVAQARDIQADRLFEEVREIADEATPLTLALAKTRIAARQWQAGKLAPRKPRGGTTAPAIEVRVLRFYDDED